MKKLLCVWIVIGIVFSACDEDINPSDIVETCTITSATLVSASGTFQTTYEYDSEKRIKRVNLTDRYIIITYNGDLISKIESFTLSDVSQGYNAYEYDAEDKLIALIFFYPDGNSLTYTYQHNASGQLISSIRPGQTQPFYEIEYDSKQNMSRYTRYFVTSTSSTVIFTNEYQYDENESPIVRVPEYYYFDASTGAKGNVFSTDGFKNNIIKIIRKDEEGTIQQEILSTEIVTNQYKFPLSFKQTTRNLTNNTESVRNLSYEYNCQ